MRRLASASRKGSIWLPPFCKAANPDSNGYDPYDYFDLGDLDQKGSVKTAYGAGTSSSN
jgi:alpha-amylase